MTDDIVARLRCYADINDAVYHPWVYAEAAAEIEGLREKIQQLRETAIAALKEEEKKDA